ncbi:MULTISPECIES: hypothetical protein [Erwinia]|uniref:Uncharacterized protein n=1 Tax=Erwinia persicina TaxID=55211 RepID=A0A3S7TH68_9GAMM|nr:MULTISPECIES: hypothetical protein [Erwinia]AXU98084.1 hypothetical protein CI789_23065 [Erwinia persicina]MBD8170224.1 hypothetical protein [Erwinia persicina]NNS10012.1 hypothetical protein [Erwinia sp. JH02]TKJ82900.1 hypothetical protein EpCFBP13511_23475 [Erwinia persicina]
MDAIRTFFLRMSRADRLSPEQRKNIGEYLLLGSSLFIVPLLFLDNPGIVVKVVLQLLWALTIAAGAMLAHVQKKKPD